MDITRIDGAEVYELDGKPALTVIEVPGDHDSMVLEPNVRVLAARLRDVIAEAEAAADPLAEAAE